MLIAHIYRSPSLVSRDRAAMFTHKTCHKKRIKKFFSPSRFVDYLAKVLVKLYWAGRYYMNNTRLLVVVTVTVTGLEDFFPFYDRAAKFL